MRYFLRNLDGEKSEIVCEIFDVYLYDWDDNIRDRGCYGVEK